MTGARSEARRTREGVILGLVASLLWGLGPVASRGALAGWSPELVTVLRLGTGAVVFHALAGRDGRWLPQDRWTWIAGIALGVDFAIYNYGMRWTTAAAGGLVTNTGTIVLLILARVVLGEPITFHRLASALVTMGGVLIVVDPADGMGRAVAPQALRGNLLVMLAAVAWGLYAVWQTRAAGERSGRALLAPIFSVATLVALPGVLRPAAWDGTWDPASTVWLVVLVTCTVGVYLAYVAAQARVALGVLAVVFATVPAFAVGLAWLLLGEPVSGRIVLGGAVIAAGILWAATRGTGSSAR